MKKWFVIFGCCLLASCVSDDMKIPDGIIPREKMVVVLADVQITEAVMMYKDSRGDDTVLKIPEYYQFVFNKHHISEKQFRESFAFYSGHPELMDKIYEDVIIEISKRQVDVPNK